MIFRLFSPLALAVGLGLGFPASAQEAVTQAALSVERISTHMGQMTMEVEATDVEVDDALRFEPYQQLEEMFLRDDVVYLMRHGPTDWSKLDKKNVAPTDCGNQRVMAEPGIHDMRNLGSLMASNGILPSEIVVSQWCRNQQTVDHLLGGVARVDPALADIPVETDGGLNLLLSLQGSKDVASIRERINAWEGNPDRKGPLLIVTHYTNIEELTQFRVFEGEILVLDPKRDNLVLGYVRLRSASPDVGHFKDALESPLNSEAMALDMVERYYAALNSSDQEMIKDVLSERWVGHGMSPSLPEQDADGWLAEVQQYTAGLSDAGFEVRDTYYADGVVTVIGTVRGTHTGDLFGIPPTGREIAFGAIQVHRVEGGAIAETWQMADRLSLLQQIESD